MSTTTVVCGVGPLGYAIRLASAEDLLAPEQVRADFRRRGVSFAEWARQQGFSRQLVSAVVSGSRKCHRGASHRIAVLLGLKDGEIA